MKNKIINIFLIILLIALSYGVGVVVTNYKYISPLAHCVSENKVPYENYEMIDMSRAMKDMFRNFYGHKYSFNKMYIPQNITVKDYFSRNLNFFSWGGFNYFEANNGELVKCGMFK